ncbi:hypothetical protein FPE01S_03_00680 [Flavihumibacter petaseus NBRC 106054]|uniref:Uncharacterized protein n=1 Tax=Flavihumibacter petaseus NBRC 106054 TaxID=1220578 RepID=A0A0E9N2G5_9BACT|nr:hypothetical protein FPE01S_03_00680 [Flavihumibacter petaseus NBRC 106054]
MNQKVNYSCQDLNYGLWVSLSEKSYDDYLANFNNDNHETTYFGWLCNGIPGYNFDSSIPMNVFTQKGNLRPVIEPHESFDHPFVKDYYQGITKDEADRRVNQMLDLIEAIADPGKKKNISIATATVAGEAERKSKWWKVWKY